MEIQLPSKQQLTDLINKNLKAKAQLTGESVELTAVQDLNGEWVLRTVNSSPYMGSKKAIPSVSTLNKTVNVSAGGNEVITIQPPVGEIWRVKLLGVDIPIPVGATSGTHSFQLFYSASNSAMNTIAEITSNFSTKLAIRANSPFNKTTCTPTNESDFSEQIRSIAITNENPLVLVYFNLTNVAQSGILGIKLVKEIEYIG